VNHVIAQVGPVCSSATSSAQCFVPVKGSSLECLPVRLPSKASAYRRDILRDEERPLRLKDIAAETSVSERPCGVGLIFTVFHALRQTFATMLQCAGDSPRVVRELMRHSDMRLTAKTYTDSSCLPLLAEMGKNCLRSNLPLYLSPKSDKISPEEGKPVQTDTAADAAQVVVFSSKTHDLANVVPDWDNLKMAEREGFEPPVTFRLHALSKRAH
jgi:hypothetical protein